jgi:CheY-like chemotaxis protein
MALKNILLVDDDLPSRRLADITLQDGGVPCVIINAKDGKEAIEMLESSDEFPDVILLDINMPVMDGFRFLAEYQNLARVDSNTKIYMLTTSTLEKDYSRAFATGLVKDYFEKPLNERHIEQIFSDL